MIHPKRKNFTVFVVLSLGYVAFLIYASYVNYQYERVVGAYFENAYQVNTPERMIAEIQKGVQGMMEAGLGPERHGALIFRKPDNAMAWQFDFLDSIVERAQAVIEWREKNYGEAATASPESLGDVYEQKMDNLRDFLIENGRADWIAQDAWYVKNHPVMYFSGTIGAIWFIVLLWIILLIRKSSRNAR